MPQLDFAHDVAEASQICARLSKVGRRRRGEWHVFAEGGQDRNNRQCDAQWKTRHVFLSGAIHRSPCQRAQWLAEMSHVNLAHRGTGSEKAILARKILAKLILRTATSIVLLLTYDPAILQRRKDGQAIL
jgi:hypothetical protein